MQGTAIEATLWREAADKHYDTLQEGKVRLLSLLALLFCSQSGTMGIIRKLLQSSVVARLVHTSAPAPCRKARYNS